MQFVTPFLVEKVTLASLFEKLVLPVHDLGDTLKPAKEQGDRLREVDQQIGVCFRLHVVTHQDWRRLAFGIGVHAVGQKAPLPEGPQQIVKHAALLVRGRVDVRGQPLCVCLLGQPAGQHGSLRGILVRQDIEIDTGHGSSD